MLYGQELARAWDYATLTYSRSRLCDRLGLAWAEGAARAAGTELRRRCRVAGRKPMPVLRIRYLARLVNASIDLVSATGCKNHGWVVAACVGWPDRPIPDSCKTADAVALAQAGAFPILADALMDAGLDEGHPVLTRLRDEGLPAIRGEWVLRELLPARARAGRATARPPS